MKPSEIFLCVFCLIMVSIIYIVIFNFIIEKKITINKTLWFRLIPKSKNLIYEVETKVVYVDYSEGSLVCFCPYQGKDGKYFKYVDDHLVPISKIDIKDKEIICFKYSENKDFLYDIRTNVVYSEIWNDSDFCLVPCKENT